MAICPIICSFYYLARALMHDVACEFACAVGCAVTIGANVLKVPNITKTNAMLCYDEVATAGVLALVFD